jgi:hypothetical protein
MGSVVEYVNFPAGEPTVNESFIESVAIWLVVVGLKPGCYQSWCVVLNLPNVNEGLTITSL